MRDRTVPLLSWAADSGRIILLGDSAHAMAPFLGQVQQQHILSTHAIKTPCQFTLTLSRHAINIPCQHILSIYPVNTRSIYSIKTHDETTLLSCPLKTPHQYILSIPLINPPHELRINTLTGCQPGTSGRIFPRSRNLRD